MTFFPPLPFVLVIAGGEQSGLSQFGKRRFRVRKLPVNLRFCLPRGVVGVAHSPSVASFVVVIPGTDCASIPLPTYFDQTRFPSRTLR